ncbi:hypothetical protein [Bacillus mobilis]|uniref:hypothetical protein n=1 Tax=Bacillus mobilis TaxID=2026190 RepID=UPI002E1A3C22|nr:hypothetical protein [Bacillus mobilis]MED0952928.1 hypothetical protein [Bacillus mobilis]
MKRFLNTLLQFVVLSFALHLLFDVVGWFVFKAPVENKGALISYISTLWLLYMYRDKLLQFIF